MLVSAILIVVKLALAVVTGSVAVLAEAAHSASDLLSSIVAAIAASRAISPRWFMPSSTTTHACCGLRRSRVSGSPYSLFRLPAVLRHGARTERMAAHISLVLVLPLLPVMATSGPR